MAVIAQDQGVAASPAEGITEAPKFPVMMVLDCVLYYWWYLARCAGIRMNTRSLSAWIILSRSFKLIG